MRWSSESVTNFATTNLNSNGWSEATATSWTVCKWLDGILIVLSKKNLRTQASSAIRRWEPGILKLVSNYNTLCHQLAAMINRGCAPLEDNHYNSKSPHWLSDDDVRNGIWAQLELDRCLEEEEWVKAERCAIQEWFMEEWVCIQHAIQTTGECRSIRQSQCLADFSVAVDVMAYQLQDAPIMLGTD